MPSVTGFTAARMLEIENSTIIGGQVVGDNLVLVRKDGLQVHAGNVRGPVGPQMPTGTLTMTALEDPPDGWLLCAGQAVSRATYAALFAALGTRYGAGDGSNTFNLPDLRGRVPVGLDNMVGSDAGRLSVPNTLGGSGGAEKHTLSQAEMPSHTHGDGTLATNSAGAHTHAYGTTPAPSQAHSLPVYAIAPFETQRTITDSKGAHTHTITGNTASAGSGAAHNNMPPYILLNYIIKY